MLRRINDTISYIEATEDPLSADIGIIKDGDATWLYDVGNGESSIEGLGDEYSVVLSHFHQDHTGNLEKLRVREVYLSKETCNHVHQGIVVNSDIRIGRLHIFPLPSSHVRGALGLEVDGTYAFVGDALYCKRKDGCYLYNAQLLKQEIEVLRGLKAQFLLVSHFKGLVRRKEEVLAELEMIYSLRDRGSSEIRLRADDETV